MYGSYSLLAFALCASAALLIALLVPGLERRRRWVGAAARGWLVASGIRTELVGFDNLPTGHCVVVANHASYADGVILQGFLPPRFSFVIKGEMQRVPLAHFLLRRIGSRFVDRFVSARSARDARELLQAAAAGESLAVFPEGTFHPEPGLQPFRAGAFAAAKKGGIAVVPLAIAGSRRLLPAGRLLPRPASLRLVVLPPIPPSDPAYASSRSLADAARRRILHVLDEPDAADGEPSRLHG